MIFYLNSKDRYQLEGSDNVWYSIEALLGDMGTREIIVTDWKVNVQGKGIITEFEIAVEGSE